jgi:hypothetical protein
MAAAAGAAAGLAILRRILGELEHPAKEIMVAAGLEVILPAAVVAELAELAELLAEIQLELVDLA